MSGLFKAWRRVLTVLGRRASEGSRGARVSRPAVAARLLARYVLRPAPTLTAASAAERERLKEAGAAALVLGAALSFALAVALGANPLQAFLTMGWLAAWALARLLILRLALSGGAGSGRRVDDAWGPALWPYAFAVVFPLDIAALAASGFLTYRGLTALGIERRHAGQAVAWAFGGQLAVEFVAWLGRASLLAFVRL